MNTVERPSRLNVLVHVLVFIVFVSAFVAAQDFARVARHLPSFVSVIGALLSVASLAMTYLRGATRSSEDTSVFQSSSTGTDASGFRILRYVLWIGSYILAIRTAGYLLSTSLFIALFLIIEAKFGIWKSVVGAVLATTALLGITIAMDMSLPESLVGW